MNKRNRLLQEYATRKRANELQTIYKALPDPDIILKENNYDYGILRDLINDPHLMATVQQRKMQVMQMGWEINYEGDKEIKEKVIEVFRELPLSNVMSDILDAIFFGFAIGEIEWVEKNNEIVPVNVIGKPQEWFIFDNENKIKLRNKKNGFYLFEEGLELPEYKFILTQYNPTYTNPYGQKVLSKCYWPVIFKRAGIEYWQMMMERYGMPFLMGRYPTGYTEEQKTEFIEQLKLMVQDNITIFENTLGIELKESPQYDIGQLYQILVDFHNKEISKAVLTVTLTTEVGKTGSYKAAEIHKDMLEYLGVSDKKLVEKSLNTLIDYYIQLNYGNVASPKIKMTKKEAVIEESAERDKILSEIGLKFSKEYFKKRYNLSDTDFEMDDSLQ